jgi:hypothetical protein
VVSVFADVLAGEVTVEAEPGKVTADKLIETIGKTRDSEHSFKARLKSVERAEDKR